MAKLNQREWLQNTREAPRSRQTASSDVAYSIAELQTIELSVKIDGVQYQEFSVKVVKWLPLRTFWMNVFDARARLLQMTFCTRVALMLVRQHIF